MKRIFTFIALLSLLSLLSVPAWAAEKADAISSGPLAETEELEEKSNENTTKIRTIWAVAGLMGIACCGGALGMAHAVAKAAGDIAEQPEAGGGIRTSMMMSLVFIETVIIYALIVAILLIFVL